MIKEEEEMSNSEVGEAVVLFITRGYVLYWKNENRT
jgi:hypothetical protein